MSGILTTSLPLPLHSRGKVRDTYRLSDSELLMVATDRVSAFDVVLPTAIPQKGQVLTSLSLFWFDRTAAIVPNHLLPDQTIPADLLNVQPDLDVRSMRVAAAEPIPFECVVRGHLAGSAWKEYRQRGAIAGRRLEAGLRENDLIPGGPMFTPATKALTGHDENITTQQLADRVGRSVARELEQLSIQVYRYAYEEARSRGLVLADTKFEFGWLGGHLILIDEVLTPDSSRYWPADRYRPGGKQESFDKQYVRDYLEEIGWNKQPPAPELPDAVVLGTQSRYREALERFEVRLVSR
jgi:phosphoribosylaminoimidazole-succinocarboxamide synthase